MVPTYPKFKNNLIYKIDLQKQLKNKCIVAGNKTARIGDSPNIWPIMALKIKPTAFMMPLTVTLLQSPAIVTIRAALFRDFDILSRHSKFPPSSSERFFCETNFWTTASCSLISRDNLSSIWVKKDKSLAIRKNYHCRK